MILIALINSQCNIRSYVYCKAGHKSPPLNGNFKPNVTKFQCLIYFYFFRILPFYFKKCHVEQYMHICSIFVLSIMSIKINIKLKRFRHYLHIKAARFSQLMPAWNVELVIRTCRDTMVANDLATQGAKASAAKLLSIHHVLQFCHPNR